jgi:phosphoribosyl-ATP pyrophosphohydrolase/phosphoribosyl-AMP cyclohydrolase
MAWLSVRRPQTADGLLPVVVQDDQSRDVLMLAWANDEALAATEATGLAHFWSRSRGELWRKGATSGNELRVVALATDCDGDAVLYRVSPAGPACHTGARSCFDGEIGGDTPERVAGTTRPFELRDLARVIDDRRHADPEASYTARLLARGPRRAGEKVVEEAGELVSAALAGSDDEVRSEAADLLYHVLVLLAARGIPLAQVEAELGARNRG